MDKKKELEYITYFTVFYLIIFGLLAIINANYEFLIYTLFSSAILFIVVKYHKKLHVHEGVISGITLTGVLFVLGGMVPVGSGQLMQVWIIPGIMTYSNIVHLLAYYIMTLLSYSLLHPHLDKKLDHNKLLLSFLLVLIALGMGGIINFLTIAANIAFSTIGALVSYQTQVSNLIYNIIGTVIACTYLVRYHKKG